MCVNVSHLFMNILSTSHRVCEAAFSQVNLFLDKPSPQIGLM